MKVVRSARPGMRSLSFLSSCSVCARGGRFMPSSVRLLMCCSGMSMYLHTCTGAHKSQQDVDTNVFESRSPLSLLAFSMSCPACVFHHRIAWFLHVINDFSGLTSVERR